MSLDVFGRGGVGDYSASSRGPPGIGFKYTEDANYDMQKKRLCNLSDPVSSQDAVTLIKFKKAITALESEIQKLHEIIDSIDKKVSSNYNNQQLFSNLGRYGPSV